MVKHIDLYFILFIREKSQKFSLPNSVSTITDFNLFLLLKKKIVQRISIYICILYMYIHNCCYLCIFHKMFSFSRLRSHFGTRSIRRREYGNIITFHINSNSELFFFFKKSWIAAVFLNSIVLVFTRWCIN